LNLEFEQLSSQRSSVLGFKTLYSFICVTLSTCPLHLQHFWICDFFEFRGE